MSRTRRDAPPPARRVVPPDLPVGSFLGPYLIEGDVLIAPTGPGRPYVLLSDELALKIYRLGDLRLRERVRIEQEARIAMRLRDVEGFVGANRTGAYEGWLIIEMPRMGESLADHLERSAMRSTDRYLGWFADVARALDEMHRLHEIVHRDIKPTNLLFDRDGMHLHVADFSVSRTLDAFDVTTTGRVLGTDRYMAPEQIRGEAVPASDQYALAVTASEILEHSEPPLTQPVRAVLQRASSHRPEDRYPSLGAFGAALGGAASRRAPSTYVARAGGIAGNAVLRLADVPAGWLYFGSRAVVATLLTTLLGLTAVHQGRPLDASLLSAWGMLLGFCLGMLALAAWSRSWRSRTRIGLADRAFVAPLLGLALALLIEGVPASRFELFVLMPVTLLYWGVVELVLGGALGSLERSRRGWSRWLQWIDQGQGTAGPRHGLVAVGLATVLACLSWAALAGGGLLEYEPNRPVRLGSLDAGSHEVLAVASAHLRNLLQGDPEACATVIERVEGGRCLRIANRLQRNFGQRIARRGLAPLLGLSPLEELRYQAWDDDWWATEAWFVKDRRDNDLGWVKHDGEDAIVAMNRRDLAFAHEWGDWRVRLRMSAGGWKVTYAGECSLSYESRCRSLARLTKRWAPDDTALPPRDDGA